MNPKETIIKKLRPIDDLMFHKMAEDRGFCEELISTILEQNISVIETTPQSSIRNLQGRSVILDALCKTKDGKSFDVEVQRANNDNHQRRVRYNSSCITVNISDPGIKFEKVPDVCIIYISEFDIFGNGCAVYHVDRTLRESKETLENGLTEIYVFAKSRDGSRVAKLMELFVTEDAYDYKNFPKISKRKHQFKEDGEEVQNMCKELDDLLKATAMEAAKKAEKKAAKEKAKVLFERGVAYKIISEVCYELTEEELRQMEKEAFVLTEKK